MATKCSHLQNNVKIGDIADSHIKLMLHVIALQRSRLHGCLKHAVFVITN